MCGPVIPVPLMPYVWSSLWSWSDPPPRIWTIFFARAAFCVYCTRDNLLSLLSLSRMFDSCLGRAAAALFSSCVVSV